MAWVATTDIDSYTVDTDISGASGGSGWGGNWTKTSGLLAVRTAPAGGFTGKVLANDASGTAVYYRQVSGVTAGSVRLRLQSSNSSVDGGPIFLADSFSGKMYVKFNSGEIQAFNHGVGYVTVASVASDTPCDVDIEFDNSGQPNQYRVRVDEGTWTSWLTVNGGSYTSITEVHFDLASTARTFIDEIEPTPAGGGNITMAADPGSYAITGTAASLEQGYEVQADTGSFSISGVAASLEQGYEIPTDAGEYLVTGTEPNLEQSLLLTVDVGLYSITGANANLEQGIMINPEEGSYVINGVDATLVYGDVLGAEPGEYLVTGTEPSLEQGFLTSIEIGSYLLTGVNANLNEGLEISVDPGSYSLTGTDANFTEGIGISTDVGSYLITGVPASLLEHSILNAAVGSYLITGVAANLAENLENIVGGRFIVGQVYYPGFKQAQVNT